MATVDLTVRGAGIFGLSIAWACVRRGARVRVVDPYGVGAGASGGLVGALAPHTPDAWNELKQFQFDSLVMMDRFWGEIETVSGICPGYARTGRLQPLADATAVERARAREADALRNWGSHAAWRVVKAEESDFWVPLSQTGWLVKDTLSARIHPRRALDAAAAAICAKGGEITEDAPDEGAVLWASGWRGLEDLSRDLGVKMGSGIKGQALALRASGHAGAPQIYAQGLHIVPHFDGTVAIGSTTERDFDDPVSTDGGLDELLDRALAVLPVLHGAPIVARWAGVRPRASSRAPVLGAWPGKEGHFVANGGFKIGFGIAPKVADLMSRILLDGEDEVPMEFRFETRL